MCLSRLTTKVTLKKDKKVYKWVHVDEDGSEYPCTQYAKHKQAVLCSFNLDAYTFGVPVPLNKHNQAVVKKIELEKYPSKFYDSGFHCFVKEKNNGSYFAGAKTQLPYIIPSGTTVQYGYQYLRGVKQHIVVTPALINPRAES